MKSIIPIVILGMVISSLMLLPKASADDSVAQEVKVKNTRNDLVIVDGETRKKTKTLTYTSEKLSAVPELTVSGIDEVTTSSLAGDWDMKIKSKNKDLFVDFSLEWDKNFEEALADWLSHWGAKDFVGTYSTVESGTIDSTNLSYVHFSIEDEVTYDIVLVSLGKINEMNAYIAIKGDELLDSKDLHKILKSVKKSNKLNTK